MGIDELESIHGRIKTITFDCYGTLIDWRGGLAWSFRELFGRIDEARIDELFAEYVSAEAAVEGGVYRSYRAVLSETASRVAEFLGADLPPDRTGRLAEMLPEWKPFPDTNAALIRLAERYRLGVLSNIDRDLFAATAKHFPVRFDFVISAEDVQAYKPATNHFTGMLAEHGPRERCLHVAQSIYHDGVPCDALDLAYVWINRYNDRNDTTIVPLAAFPDLRGFADVMCR